MLILTRERIKVDGFLISVETGLNSRKIFIKTISDDLSSENFEFIVSSCTRFHYILFKQDKQIDNSPLVQGAASLSSSKKKRKKNPAEIFQKHLPQATCGKARRLFHSCITTF